MAKVLVSLDDALLRRVDRIANARGLLRSDTSPASPSRMRPAPRTLRRSFEAGSCSEAALVDLAAARDDLGFETIEPGLSRVAHWAARGLTAHDAAYVAAAEAAGTLVVTDDDQIVEIARELARPLARIQG